MRTTRIRPATRQRGVALVLIAISMVVLILMAGLALDIGHMMLDKARLQNAVDAAALSAAKTLDETSNTALATAAALQALGLDANTAGNNELGATYDNGNLQVTVQYSSTLPPFTPGSAAGPYVRVIATHFAFPTILLEVANFNQLSVSASAVAGPSPTINTACNIAPIMACGDPAPAPLPSPCAGGLASLWGYCLNDPQVLKSASPGSTAVGPGNFQLIQLGGTGANIVRQNLAGDYNSCLTTADSVQTETGNETGPVYQGLNTRFGIYAGSMSMAQFPPDVVTQYASPLMTVDSSGNIWYQPAGGTAVQITSSTIGDVFDYQDYQNAIAWGPWNYQPVDQGGPGVFNRRVLTVPVGDCTGTANGSTTVPVLGFACFFILQPVTQQGTTDYIIGQFEGNCQSGGTPGPDPGAGPGPYVIELYHDPGSPDS